RQIGINLLFCDAEQVEKLFSIASVKTACKILLTLFGTYIGSGYAVCLIGTSTTYKSRMLRGHSITDNFIAYRRDKKHVGVDCKKIVHLLKELFIFVVDVKPLQRIVRPSQTILMHSNDILAFHNCAIRKHKESHFVTLT